MGNAIKTTIKKESNVFSGTRKDADGKNLPFLFRTLHMDERVLQLLQEEELFQLKEGDLEAAGFERCTDIKSSKHFAHECFLHSTDTNSNVQSLHPRSFKPMEKPPAPKFIRAFFRAIREINDFAALAQSLPEGPTRTVIENGWLFGDLIVKVNYGSDLKGKNLVWNMDGKNSFLQLSVCIKGSQCLFISRADSKTKKQKQESLIQSAGQVSLSSPYCYSNASGFTRSKFSTRAISLRASALIPEDFALNDVSKVMRDVTKFLKGHDVRLPNIAEVERAIKEITEMESAEKNEEEQNQEEVQMETPLVLKGLQETLEEELRMEAEEAGEKKEIAIDAEKEDMSSSTEKKGAIETPAHGAGNVDSVEKTQENSDAEVLTSKEDPPSIDPIVASPESNSENDTPAEALDQENSTEEIMGDIEASLGRVPLHDSCSPLLIFLLLVLPVIFAVGVGFAIASGNINADEIKNDFSIYQSTNEIQQTEPVKTSWW